MYNISWTLIDSKGNTYVPKETLFDQNEDHTTYTMKFNPIPEEDMPDCVKVVPGYAKVQPLSEHLRESIINYKPNAFNPVLKRKGFGDISINSIKQINKDIIINANVDPIQDMRLQATRIILTNGQNGVQCSKLERLSPNEMNFWFENASLKDLESIIFYDTSQNWDLTQAFLIYSK